MLRTLYPTIAAAALLLYPDAVSAIEIDRIIAVVDEDVILQSELDTQMRRVRDQLREQGTPIPPISILERQLIERLVVQKIQVQIAERMGMRVDDRMLDTAIAEIAERNKLQPAQFREILEQDGYDFVQFREDMRHEIMISQLQQREVENRVTVSNEEVENYLDNQVAQGESDLEYHISHILITPQDKLEGAVEAARDRAEDVLKQLREGADFAQMAVSYSSDQQALQGGDLGWRKANELPSLFADVVTRLAVGDVSNIIPDASGFHIVKLTERRAGEKVMVEQTSVRHVLIETNDLVTDDDARTRLEQLKLRLEGGADFAEIARTNSDDRATALEGGDLGWVSPGQMVPDFEEVMNRVPTGAISRPFQTEYGWHILQVVDRRSYDGTEEVRRAKARAAIKQRKVEEKYQTWLRELRDEAYVELRLVGE
jgi:peptidyl-prolyl cis-trans isomerase SurA